MTPCDHTVLAPVRVWDLPIRLFHWALLATVAVAAVTGFLLPLDWFDVHLAAGTTVAVLLLFRLVWGFTGSGTSRFASFAPSPRAAWTFLRDQIRGSARHFTGHNPAGAVMIFALLGTLAVLVASGAVVLGGVDKQGPLRAIVSFAAGASAQDLHHWAAIALLALIAGHVGGVVLESWRSWENLPLGMITGRKRAAPGFANTPPRPRLAALALVAAGLGLTVPLALLWQRPAAGLPPAAVDARYADECGACHTPFHPSLLTAATWQGMMTSLPDHFGEDASLPQDVAAAIASYLAANSAEHWDTRAAHVFRVLDETDPYRITASPFWIARHRDIDPALFGTEKVGTKSNCEACHGDARQGLFMPQAIRFPKELTK